MLTGISSLNEESRRGLWQPSFVLSLGSLLVLLAACGVDEGAYVAANEALMAEVPAYPLARQANKGHSGYYNSDERFSRPAGYDTHVWYQIATSVSEIHDFYQMQLSSLGWTLMNRSPRGLSFRKGSAFFSVVTVQPARTAAERYPGGLRYQDRIFEFNIVVDHDRY